MKFVRSFLLLAVLMVPLASAHATPPAQPASVSMVTVAPAQHPLAPNDTLFKGMALAAVGATGAAASKSRKMNLSQSYIFNGETFGPGNDIEVPEGFPDIDGETGAVVHPPGSTAARNAAASARINGTGIVPTSNRVAGEGDSPSTGPGLGVTVSGKTADELEGMTKEDLISLAESKGITVERADGSEGTPLKSDYVSALGKTATA